MAAPTYFGSASNPADGGSANEPVTLDVTPPATMVSGDLVVFGGFYVGTVSGSLTMVATGGQTWNGPSASFFNGQEIGLWWCQFNGTWGANPSINFPTGSGTRAASAIMHVFRPAAASTWSVDVAYAAAAEAATGAGSPVVITGVTPTTDDTVTLAGWTQYQGTTWAAPSGAGWVTSGATSTTKFQNLAGGGLSAAFAHRLLASPAATGDVSKVPGLNAVSHSFIATWKAVAVAPLERNPAWEPDTSAIPPDIDEAIAY